MDEKRLKAIEFNLLSDGFGLVSNVDGRWLVGELTRYERAYVGVSNEVEQILGKALGYPEYGPEMFPDGVVDGSVCVGDHVPESLALQAAKAIADASGEIERLKELLVEATGG